RLPAAGGRVFRAAAADAVDRADARARQDTPHGGRVRRPGRPDLCHRLRCGTLHPAMAGRVRLAVRICLSVREIVDMPGDKIECIRTGFSPGAGFSDVTGSVWTAATSGGKALRGWIPDT